MPPLSPLLQSPPSSSHHCRSCSRRRVVALVACTVASFLRASVPCRDVVAVFELQLSLSQLVADFIDTVPRSWSSTWSWSVVGDAYDSGLPAAAVVVMVGVAGISEELKLQIVLYREIRATASTLSQQSGPLARPESLGLIYPTSSRDDRESPTNPSVLIARPPRPVGIEPDLTDPDAPPVREQEEPRNPDKITRRPVGIKPDLTDPIDRDSRTFAPSRNPRNPDAPPVREQADIPVPPTSRVATRDHPEPRRLLLDAQETTHGTPDASDENRSQRPRRDLNVTQTRPPEPAGQRDVPRSHHEPPAPQTTPARRRLRLRRHTMTIAALARTLNGMPPTTFSGDRSTSTQFLREFERLRRLNRSHPLMTNPEQRIKLALSYIDGPADNWRNKRDVIVRHLDTTTAQINEALWDDFLTQTPRLASPTASILDLVKPADEQPRPPRNACRSTSPTAPATTHDESSDPPLPLPVTSDPPAAAAAPQRAEELQNTVASIDDDGDGTLFAPRVPVPLTPDSVAHTTDGTTKKRKHESNVEDDKSPVKRFHARLARRRVPLPRLIRYARRPPVIPPPPVDDSSGPSDFDFTIDPTVAAPESPPPRPPRSPRRPSSPRLASSTYSIIASTPSHAATPTLSKPEGSSAPPAQLLSNQSNTPRAEQFPRLPTAEPPSVVEDDNNPRGGVKTLDDSVLDPVHPTPPPQNPRYADIFPRHAFEQPRDPDEVAPQTSRRNPPVITTTQQTVAAAPIHQPLRATATTFIPRPPIIGPAQARGDKRVLQHRTSAIDLIRTRTATRINHMQYVKHTSAATTSPRLVASREQPASQVTHALTRSRDERRFGPQQRTPHFVYPRSQHTGPMQTHGFQHTSQNHADRLLNATPPTSHPAQSNTADARPTTRIPRISATHMNTTSTTTTSHKKKRFIRDE
ncbi:hypothetical protein EDB85DRAFT_1896972 [Lactarius pseudohatsudake]|nr:hypothetical protein EDB85DRAFT_1896972 [Lactarius pseudohatsudake]